MIARINSLARCSLANSAESFASLAVKITALVKSGLMTTSGFLIPLLLVFLAVFPASAQKSKKPMTS